MKEAAQLMCTNSRFSSAAYPIPHLDLARKDISKVHERLSDCCKLRSEADADRSLRERAAVEAQDVDLTEIAAGASDQCGGGSETNNMGAW